MCDFSVYFFTRHYGVFSKMKVSTFIVVAVCQFDAGAANVVHVDFLRLRFMVEIVVSYEWLAQ